MHTYTCTHYVVYIEKESERAPEWEIREQQVGEGERDREFGTQLAFLLYLHRFGDLFVTVNAFIPKNFEKSRGRTKEETLPCIRSSFNEKKKINK